MEPTNTAVIDPPETSTATPVDVPPEALASADLATTHAARRTGLLGRDDYRGVLVLRPARQIHTFGMRFAIDVAWCDRTGVVLRRAVVAPNRLSAWVFGAHAVLEARAGTFDRLGICEGDRVAFLPVGGAEGTWVVKC